MTGWILLNAALKGTIVLAAAWFLTLLLRKKSAAARHLVWTAAAAAMLALPFLSIGLPVLRFPVRAAALNGGGLVFRVVSTVAPEAPSTAQLAESRPQPSAGSSIGTLPGTQRLALSIWAFGTVVVLLQMMGAYFAMWRKRRAARRFDDRGLSSALEIQAPADLLEAAPGRMPMTFGLLRPAIFMPADAAEWTEERLRLVLLHELAHVRRGDLATHLLARTALALHWWNPLAWMAWREFIKERERAADDLVLSAGARASDYASHLLAVARSMRSGPATAWAAVAMARRSQLEGRLLAILDGGIRRGAANRLAPLAAVVLAVALVAPFAALQAQNQTAPPPELDATIRAANSQKNHDILDYAAKAYMELHKYDAAQTLLENSLAIRGQVAGEQGSAYAVGLVKLGDLAEKRRRYDEADLFYAKAVSLGDRPEVAQALLYLGIKAYRAQNAEAAWDFFQRTVRVQAKGPHAGQAYTWLALMRKNEPDAEMLFQKALGAMDSNEPAAATTLELYGAFLRFHQRDPEAEQKAALAREVRKANSLQAASSQRPSSPDVRRVGNGVTAPALVQKIEPWYTPEARAAKFQGTVLLYVEVTPEGRAENIRVARSLGLGLDEEAIDAVKRWVFRPGRDQDGKAVTVAATIEVNFRLM